MSWAWSSSQVETYDTHELRDPLASAVDVDTGVIYVLVGDQLRIISGGDMEMISVPQGRELESFFTPGAGRRCPALATENHLLIVSKTKLLIVSKTEVREVSDSRWCLCASDGPKIFLADKDGSVYSAEHPLSSTSFPGNMTLVCKSSGQHQAVDGNCLEKVEDFVKAPEHVMRPRDSGSVIKAMAVQKGKVFFCKGHGLYSDGNEEILKDERSSKSFAFPSALFIHGDAVFSQCPDGIRKLDMRSGSVVLALAASDMVIDGDPGSPEPSPKDFIGVDRRFCYFLVERDFRCGQALRRWRHGVRAAFGASAPVAPSAAGATEMKVTAKKGAGLYVRSAERMLKGIDATEDEAAKPPVQHLRVTALGNAIDVAVLVGVNMQSSGLARICRVQTSYVTMEGSAAVPQIFIDLEKQ